MSIITIILYILFYYVTNYINYVAEIGKRSGVQIKLHVPLLCLRVCMYTLANNNLLIHNKF